MASAPNGNDPKARTVRHLETNRRTLPDSDSNRQMFYSLGGACESGRSNDGVWTNPPSAVPSKKKWPSRRLLIFLEGLNCVGYQSSGSESLWSSWPRNTATLWPSGRIHNRPTHRASASTYHGPRHRTRGEIGSRNKTHKRAEAPHRRSA